MNVHGIWNLYRWKLKKQLTRRNGADVLIVSKKNMNESLMRDLRQEDISCLRDAGSIISHKIELRSKTMVIVLMKIPVDEEDEIQIRMIQR